LKRLFDIFSAAFLLLLLSPVMIIVFIALLIYIGSNPIFIQKRPGLNNRIFKLYKFKSMTEEVNENGVLLPDNLRLTSFGKLLRVASIDELPQLLNVLKGDMSLIGPRPLLPEYLSLYNDFQLRRHEVRPGITGWAQVNGRNVISWEEKFILDVWYVDNRNIFLDLRILYLTFIKVLVRQGVHSNSSITMEKFKGSL